MEATKRRPGIWVNLALISILGWVLGPAAIPARADEGKKSPSGEDHPSFFAMNAKHGLILVSNEDRSYFFVRIQGNKVRQGTIGEGDDRFGVVVVDDLIVQFGTAGISQFYKGDASKLTDEDILKKHAEWEIAYDREKFNKPFQMGMNLHIKGLNKKVYYYWILLDLRHSQPCERRV